jgi:DNA-binding NarL/FixJ family response regulator
MELGKPRKIFIVDDDPLLSEALKDYLSRQVPHDITIFKTGEECLRNMKATPEIIILDYNLNSLERTAANGMEILHSIKHMYPSVHVIMLSSQERYSIALKTIQEGAEQYVIKGKDAFEEIDRMIGRLD